MVEVSTSILNVKDGEEASTFLELEKAKTDYFHIDVMDGKFVEKDTYSKMLEDASYIKRISNLPLDVHLMTYNVLDSINDFAVLEPNIITFHYEACSNEDEVMECINHIKNLHARVGLSIKPDTDVKEIYPFLKFIHVVLIMTVEPGKGGQTFLSEMVKKIKLCKEYITENHLETDIEVDGGINLATMDKVKDAGANILVAGTAILKAKNFEDIIKELKIEEIKMRDTLVIYYSFSGNSKKVAEYVKNKLDADILELEPAIPFSDDYDEVVKEWQNNDIKKDVEIKKISLDLAKYSKVVLITSTWWYGITPVMKKFLKENDLSEKDVIVAASNAGWIGHCFKDYETLVKGNIKGKLDLLFSSNDGERDKMLTATKELDKWIEQL